MQRSERRKEGASRRKRNRFPPLGPSFGSFFLITLLLQPFGLSQLCTLLPHTLVLWAFTLVFVSAKCTPPLFALSSASPTGKKAPKQDHAQVGVSMRLCFARGKRSFFGGEVCPTRISHPVGKGIRTGDEALLHLSWYLSGSSSCHCKDDC